MELTELLSRGHALLEAEIQQVLKEAADQEAANQAAIASYMAAVETTLHEALPECTWRYLDTSAIAPEPSNLYLFPEARLIAPNCAPIQVNLCLHNEGDVVVAGKLSKIPLVVPMVHYDSDEGPRYLYDARYGAKETNNLSYALALAMQRKQEFECLADKFSLELLAQEARRRKQLAARQAKEAAQAFEPSAEGKVRLAIGDLVTEILDAALAARKL